MPVWRPASSPPFLTIAQNGSDAWPCVTTTIRAEAIRSPRARVSGDGRAATASSPRTTRSGSRTSVVRPQPARASANEQDEA